MFLERRKVCPAAGVAAPITTFCAVLIVIAVDWLPVLKMMLSDVPTPDVDSKVSVEDAVVPPMCNGVVSDVVSVGEDEYDGATPTPPDTNTDPVATSASDAIVVEADA